MDYAISLFTTKSYRDLVDLTVMDLKPAVLNLLRGNANTDKYKLASLSDGINKNIYQIDITYST